MGLWAVGFGALGFGAVGFLDAEGNLKVNLILRLFDPHFEPQNEAQKILVDPEGSCFFLDLEDFPFLAGSRISLSSWNPGIIISSKRESLLKNLKNFARKENSSPGKAIERGAQLLEKNGDCPYFLIFRTRGSPWRS